MRTIERSSVFKRDYKRAKAAPRHRKGLDSLLSNVVEMLLFDRALPPSGRDHALGGDWMGYRECHSLIRGHCVWRVSAPTANSLVDRPF